MDSRPTVRIVLPVYNEEIQLRDNVLRVLKEIKSLPEYIWQISIVDNASTDRTKEIAISLQYDHADSVSLVCLNVKGKGNAVISEWMRSKEDILCFMDIDLSADLSALKKLVDPIVSNKADIVIGSRLVPGAEVERDGRREMVSRVYSFLIKFLFQPSFVDAPCGFKAIRGTCAHNLLPCVENRNWFFDTELLLLADYSGCRIREIPVRWVDDAGTTVSIAKTAIENVKGLCRVKWGMWTGKYRKLRLG